MPVLLNGAIVFIALLITTANTALADEKKTPASKTRRPPLLLTTVEVRQGAIQAIVLKGSKRVEDGMSLQFR